MRQSATGNKLELKYKCQ